MSGDSGQPSRDFIAARDFTAARDFMAARDVIAARDFIAARAAAYDPRCLSLDGFRRSAVLVPLLREDGAWRLLFTRRTEDVEHHKGQVSFPGGAMEEGENAEDAALREAWEEIGLQPGRITPAGRLNDRWTPSGYLITPVIGLLDGAGELRANPSEVSRIFTAPLAFFADERRAEHRSMVLDGIARDVILYRYDGETIWGATALILRDLLALLGLRNGADPLIEP